MNKFLRDATPTVWLLVSAGRCGKRCLGGGGQLYAWKPLGLAIVGSVWQYLLCAGWVYGHVSRAYLPIHTWLQRYNRALPIQQIQRYSMIQLIQLIQRPIQRRYSTPRARAYLLGPLPIQQPDTARIQCDTADLMYRRGSASGNTPVRLLAGMLRAI